MRQVFVKSERTIALLNVELERRLEELRRRAGALVLQTYGRRFARRRYFVRLRRACTLARPALPRSWGEFPKPPSHIRDMRY